MIAYDDDTEKHPVHPAILSKADLWQVSLAVLSIGPLFVTPEGSRTTRSREQEPPGTPSGDANAADGWLPSVTFHAVITRHHVCASLGMS
jgi:hypothetical protein